MSFKKKLIEVALPLDAINRGCEEDKNRKTGHIRNLHKWFAPMPLPSWRAMLFAAIVDDPGEYLPEEEALSERKRLMEMVARLSRFEAYQDRALLNDARAVIRRATDGAPPVIVDPFCGGGSTIVEAQRLGLRTFASDLNPVPVLITTMLCRVPAVFGAQRPVHPSSDQKLIATYAGLSGFKADVVYYAKRVREMAWGELKSYYPPVQGATPFAYRWAWTVASPDPAARGKYTPLVSTWWLSKHRSTRAWISPVRSEGGIEFAIEQAGSPPTGTTGRAGARCLYSDNPIELEYVREQGRRGQLRQALLAIGARENGQTSFIPADAVQISAASSAPALDLPGIPMPEAALGFRVQQYGVRNFLNLFTKRQAFTINTFARLVALVHEEIERDAVSAGLAADDVSLEMGGTGARAYADSVTGVLGICVGKLAQSNSILVRWFIDPRNGSGKATPAFDRHAIPMVWDFVETNPFGGSVGDWTGPVLETALRAFDLAVVEAPPAEVMQQDARRVAQEVPPSALIATDPPYYANIGYADLSDFFYLWLRPALSKAFPKLLSTVATPKGPELIATPFRHAGNIQDANEYFRSGFADVFGSLADRSDARFPILIVYAIKQSEETDDVSSSTGWEVFLEGLVSAGLMIVATWPVRTTTDTRMIGIGNNALASAIFVVGRDRPVDAATIARRDFIGALRAELPSALAHLQRANIAPVDLAQAAIGPGMAVYTRHSKVMETSGDRLSVREALTLINQVLDEVLAEQESDFDADSRWALAWFEQVGFSEGEYGLAETLSKAKNISISGAGESRILESRAGKVRLLKPTELRADWDPVGDTRVTAWEAVHQLIRVLGTGGEGAAATVVANLANKADIAREMAYRLYQVCERRKRPQEALAYNGLVQSWPEIVRLAQSSSVPQPDQGQLL